MHKQSANKQNIKAIILAGNRDFGRCPIASRLPTALWPIAGEPVLERLLEHLSRQGIRQAVVCTNGDGLLLQQSFDTRGYIELEFLEEPLPVGTAGCIRDAAGDETDGLLLVLPASITCPPKIDALISAHHNGQSDLTVMFNPAPTNGKLLGEPAGICICETSVLEHIPKEGYFDIKEGLIPEMLRAGRTVHTAVLPNHVRNFRDWQGYLYAIANYLENTPNLNADLRLRKRTDSQTVWIADNASVDAKVQIYGPVAIMDGSMIAKETIIFGPTIIGRDVTVGKNTLIRNSVLWDGSTIGQNCEIHNCIVDYNAEVLNCSLVDDEAVIHKQTGKFVTVANKAVASLVNGKAGRLYCVTQPLIEKIRAKLSSATQSRELQPYVQHGLWVSVLVAVFLWSYWPGFADLWNIWQRSDEYSSGLLVPFLAVYILWSRRHDISQCPMKPCLWGLLAFAVAQGVRLFGLFFMYSSAERLSIALSIAALVLLLFGWQFIRKVTTILLFLCLMLPWPNRVQAAVALPLQHWATSSAVFCLEMIGYEVVQEGNIIHIGSAIVAVAEACNGLRMITAFLVISALVILLGKRAWWEKLIVLVSSLPIALLCNTARLTITALAFTVLTGAHWERIFHDFGGYAMMPLALAAVVTELWLLTKLTVLPAKEQKFVIRRQKPVVNI